MDGPDVPWLRVTGRFLRHLTGWNARPRIEPVAGGAEEVSRVMTSGSRAVVPIDLGLVRAYLVCCGRRILVDAGMPGSEERIARAVRQAGVDPVRDLGLIVLTHGHTDHMGAARPLRDRWRVPIAMHRLDAEAAARGVDPPLRSTGLAGRFVALAARAGAHRPAPAFEPDVQVDGEMDLQCMGLDARILPTPGHTAGSITLLTAKGDALIGDLVIGESFRRGHPRLPYVAEDPDLIRQSVRHLLARSPRRVYSAHGRPFTVEDLARWSG